MNNSSPCISPSHTVSSSDTGNNVQNSPSEECTNTKLRVTEISSILWSTLLYTHIS